MVEEKVIKESKIERLGFVLSRSVETWMPDPLIFALILTIATVVMAVVIMRPYEVMPPDAVIKWLFMDSWYRGFWELLAFAMQMCLVLVTGYAIAYHPLIYRGLGRLARIPKSTKSAAALTAFMALICGWINWGLSLIVGAVLARTIGIEFYKQRRPLHYPVVCAAGYAGLGLNWHWGLSASAPLISNTPGHFFTKVFKEVSGKELVPLSETIFSTYTIANMILIIITGVIVFWALAPKIPEQMKGIDAIAPHVLEAVKKEEEVSVKKPERLTIADKLENSKILAGITGLFALLAMVYWFGIRGFIAGLDLNSLNFSFILIGFLMYMNPIAYMRAIARATPAVAGIILQFPFYAGIMGIMRYSHVVSGGPNLATVIAQALAAGATPFTWPAICLWISGFVNLFIPSGGGEWAAIGEILVRTSGMLGVPLGKTIIAFAAGDQWTNLFQPFWAIALLGITGTRARDIFGYCIGALIFGGIVFTLGLTFIPY
ncbi:MAG: TIGR00366 family protein [Nitrososphaerota archaeon]|nr:TIGR00366 family protein [Nitrososphaerota archaeon]